MRSLNLATCLAVPALLAGLAAHADPAPFDLAGPVLEVSVTRDGKTLPLAQVPELSGGDRVQIKADFPGSQSAHYLMVLAFLRGATNPPPADWFIRCETWKAPCSTQGLTVTVPQEAQQVLVLLAPTASGDFKTLVGAVRGKPGAFVRTSQDLNQATLDRSRLERYLTAIHALDSAEPARVRLAAPLLARSLAIKVDDKCLDRMPGLQIPCLMQGGNNVVLSDGHSTSIVEAVTAGPVATFVMDASYTPQASYGYYSPYVASVLDIARIFDSFRTAQYQYIPALATLHSEQMQLLLNTAPSFHSPKSVLVTALPAVEPVQLPPLHAVDPKEIYCARKTSLVLPVEGAPLVFSTSYAHNLTLKISSKEGKTLELPAHADAQQGGFVVDTSGVGANLGEGIRAQLHGFWGFTPYEGPSFQMVNSRTQSWALAHKDETLIVGRDGTVHLQAASVSCVDGIMLRDPAGKELKTEWKPVKPDEVEVKLPLEGASPGKVTLLVTQYGTTEPQPVEVRTFAEASRLDRFILHAGDTQGLLKGARLDQVATVSLKDVAFQPGQLTSTKGADELTLTALDPQAAAALTASDAGKAHVTLKDGRMLDIGATIDAPRPKVTLIAKSVQLAASSAESHIRLTSPDDLPQDAQLTFSVKAEIPKRFPRDARLEVATEDGAYSTALSLSNGALTLGDAYVAVARLDPAKAFGLAAFGPLQFRVVVGEGAGDWQPLVKLVRLPLLRELSCPASPELACKLTGTNLFLLDAVAGNPGLEHAVEVPNGFPDLALPVPHPSGGRLYVKLRDDPDGVHTAAFPGRGGEGERVRHAVTGEPAPTQQPTSPRAANPTPDPPGPT